MKIHRIVLLLVLLAPTRLLAQCAGCVVDSSFTAPGIYPNPLPDGTQGQAYNEDVTFVLFTDTSGLAVNYFKITSVTGIPFGLQWQCNNASTGCQYDPQVSVYGCVKICGTPLQPGDFMLNVNIDANLELVGTQQSTINIPIHIAPAGGGNAGFTFNPATGCDSLTVSFNALITGPSIPSYAWDFDDGTVSDQPVVQHFYASPDTYAVTLQTTLSQLAITDVDVPSVNDNWCGDVEEPSLPFVGCQGSPDLYFVVTDAAGNGVFTSNEIGNTNSATWNGLSIPLSNPPYSLTVWDADNVSVNDNLGMFSFAPSATSVISLSGAGGTTVNVNIGMVTVANFSDTDTVVVLPLPDEPVISAFPNDTICSGGSAVLLASGDSGLVYQWYVNGTPLANAADTLEVGAEGNYSVTGTSPAGCVASSEVFAVTQMPALPTVNFQINGTTLTTFLTQYSLQWFFNGAPIPGATQDVFNYTASGAYHLQACDDFGCCRSSDTFNLVFTDVAFVAADYDVFRFNRVQNELHVNLPAGSRCDVTDVLGRCVRSFTTVEKPMRVSLNHLPSGHYIVTAETQTDRVVSRFVVTH